MLAFNILFSLILVLNRSTSLYSATPLTFQRGFIDLSHYAYSFCHIFQGGTFIPDSRVLKFIPILVKLLPPTTTSTWGTFSAISLSFTNPEWPTAIMMFTPESANAFASFWIDSISSKNLRFSGGLEISYDWSFLFRRCSQTTFRRFGFFWPPSFTFSMV